MCAGRLFTTVTAPQAYLNTLKNKKIKIKKTWERDHETAAEKRGGGGGGEEGKCLIGTQTTPNTETDFTGRLLRRGREYPGTYREMSRFGFSGGYNPFSVLFLSLCRGAVKRMGVVLLIGIELLTPSFVSSLHATLHLMNWYQNLGFWLVNVTRIHDNCTVVDKMQNTTHFYTWCCFKSETRQLNLNFSLSIFTGILLCPFIFWTWTVYPMYDHRHCAFLIV